MRHFKFCHHYKLKMRYSFGHLSKAALNEILRDGRSASRLLYRELPRIFSNLRCECVDTNSQRYVSSEGFHIQFRTLGYSAQTNPHKQNGTQRTYNEIEHANMFEELDFILLAYVGKMPQIQFAAIPIEFFYRSDGRPKPNINTDEALALIENAHLL